MGVAISDLTQALLSKQAGDNEFTNDILEEILIRPSLPGEVTFLQDIAESYLEVHKRIIVEDIRKILKPSVANLYAKALGKYRGGDMLVNSDMHTANKIKTNYVFTRTGKDSNW